jgi:diguanylate cyclase (GGDEF)-like protein
MGTPAEERFDRITRMAKQMFDVPMAVIDIVGEHIAWLKSIQGFDGIEGLRKDSYCHHTVLSEDIFLVSDARTDCRVSDSDFADTWVFYAGVPVHFESQRVGVLCIGDSQPREFSRDTLGMLYELAGMAEQEFEVAALSEAQLTLARSHQELEMKSQIDVMTRLWNREAITRLLEVELDGAHTTAGLAVLMIDVDHFKSINDTYGHAAGDESLRVVSERLRRAVRPTDAVGRFGGDEFIAVLKDTTVEETIKVSERLCHHVSGDPVHLVAESVPLSCSIGSAMAVAGDIPESILERADQALYSAKSAGRNRAEVFQYA